jgi:Rrf2 family protein
VGRLAQETGVPSAFLGKVIQALQRAGLVDAHRGRKGGVRLAVSASEISLERNVEALNRTGKADLCMLGFPGCTGRPECPVRECCRESRVRQREILARHTVADLSRLRRAVG